MKLFLNYLTLLTELGLVIFFCIFISVIIGRSIDAFLNTTGIFTVVFLIIGLIAAYLGVSSLLKSRKVY